MPFSAVAHFWLCTDVRRVERCVVDGTNSHSCCVDLYGHDTFPRLRTLFLGSHSGCLRSVHAALTFVRWADVLHAFVPLFRTFLLSWMRSSPTFVQRLRVHVFIRVYVHL